MTAESLKKNTTELGENDLESSHLADQYREVSVNFRAVWDMYLKFYVAFMALNFTALGLVLQYMDRKTRWTLVASFVIQNILSATTGLGVAVYSRYAARQQQAILDAWRGKSCDEVEVAPQNMASIPGTLGFWSGCAISASQCLFIACWIFTLFIERVK